MRRSTMGQYGTLLVRALGGLFSIVLLCGFDGATCNYSATDRDIAMAFFPTTWEEDGVIGFRDICTRRTDFDGDGVDNYIVAAYTNNFDGAVKVIRVDPSPIVVSSASDELEFYENHPQVALPDLDSDGVPEIVVRYARVRYSSVWVFRWAEPKLLTIGPMESSPDGPWPDLEWPMIEDLDGDGVEELIDQVRSGKGEGWKLRVFSLGEELYSEVSTEFLWVGAYEAQVSLTDRFESDAKGATLRVVNRKDNGSQPITDGEVVLNGQIVVSLRELASRYAEVPVRLSSTNSLRVILRDGDSDSRIVVSVQKSE